MAKNLPSNAGDICWGTKILHAEGQLEKPIRCNKDPVQRPPNPALPPKFWPLSSWKTVGTQKNIKNTPNYKYLSPPPGFQFLRAEHSSLESGETDSQNIAASYLLSTFMDQASY